MYKLKFPDGAIAHWDGLRWVHETDAKLDIILNMEYTVESVEPYEPNLLYTVAKRAAEDFNAEIIEEPKSKSALWVTPPGMRPKIY